LQRLQKLYVTESARVGAIDPDPQATEARLHALAANLNAQEYAWLQAQALNRKEEADARFFAAYLASLSGQDASQGALKAIAAAPLPKTKSEAVLDLERQIRAVPIEGMSRMCKNPLARDALLEVEQAQKDEFLRDRTHRGLYAYHTCTDMVQQDKDALGKVIYDEGKK
jgi:hypothetical protein